MDFIKTHAYFLLGGACIIIVGIIYVISRSPGVTRNGEVIYEPIKNMAIIEAAEIQEPAFIFVEIMGEVNNPDVYELPEGSRVYDVLELAGGATENADLNHAGLLRASVVVDGMKIIIPSLDAEIENVFIYSSLDGGSQGIKNDGIVNINTATLSELQTLSGVGPVLAQNIINFRETHGDFSSIDDLINVNRIGAVTLENLRPYIMVGD